jgi:small subunit ribosomal protein S2
MARKEPRRDMTAISMKALLESGVHFGHRTNKWDPRMKPYIFTERNGIHIIDLQQTVKLLNQAFGVIRDVVAEGGTVLFVGTKRQAQETIRDEADRAGMPYVTERWLGGMLTNWSTMHARIQELERLEQLRDSGEINRLTKKEGLLIQREIDRLLIRLSGVRSMQRLPELLFVVDIGREEAAVHEANLLNIPVVALVDTNCNPQGIDYVIPSNDDAIRAIKLLVARVAEAVLEGKALRKEDESAEGDEMSAADEAETPRVRKVEQIVEPEEEPEEGALLGEATLAKLSASRKPEEAALEPAAAEASSETENAPAAAAAPAATEAQNAPPAAVSPETPEAAAEPADAEAQNAPAMGMSPETAESPTEPPGPAAEPPPESEQSGT